MNNTYLKLILICFIGMLIALKSYAQGGCNLNLNSIDYGEVFFPNSLVGNCNPKNTLDIEISYLEGMSDSLKVNGSIFPTTGSPQKVQLIGIPDELIVELVGTNCYHFEDVNLYELPDAPVMMEGDTVFCADDRIARIVLSGHPNHPFYWVNEDGTCVQSLFFSGTYNEEWTYPHLGSFSVYQCVNGKITKPLYINIREGLPVQIMGDLHFCESNYTTLHVAINGEDATTGYDIIWHTPIGTIYEVSTINAEIEYFYSAEVTDDTGCLGRATVLVEQINAPQLMIIPPEPFCEGNSTELRATASGPICNHGCSYTWQTPNGNMLNTQIIEATTIGTYTVTAIGTEGCSASKSILIEDDCEP